jgi:Cu(I)-responsive transcriptional regulator
MNIGLAAAATGVSAKRIRYYQQIGLLDAAARSAAGYRVFEESDLNTLSFIRRARRLGFSVPKIGTLLELWRDRDRASSSVKQLAQAHIAELQEKIEELQSMVDTLQNLAEHCDGDSRPDCPILNNLERRDS